MAYVRIYYHREPKRVAPHVRYIARRPESDGLRGLGAAFRELRGDVDACVRLLERHAAQARVQAGGTTRDGPFVRLLFTLPAELAARVARSDARLPDGARRVLRDAVEATFRSAGRQLQGVYAIHFHAAQRAVHGHVHVDLSPVDTLGRSTFVTAEQRERLRDVWEREVVKAVERAERRGHEAPDDELARDHTQTHTESGSARAEAASARSATASEGSTRTHVANGAHTPDRGAPARTPTQATRTTAAGAPHGVDRSTSAGTRDATMRVLAPGTAHRPTTSRTTDDADAGATARRPYARRRQHLPYVPVLTEWLLGRSRAPLVDLFLRALVARTERRLAQPRPALAVRFALGLPVPRVIVRPTTPLVRPALLRLPYWS